MTKSFSGIGGAIRKEYITKILYSPVGTSSKRDTGLKEQEDLFLPLYEHNQSIKSFEEEFSIVDWTQEAEDFCKKVQDKMIEINTELANYLQNINKDDSHLNIELDINKEDIEKYLEQYEKMIK